MRRLLLFAALLLTGSALLAQNVSSRFSARERGWVTFGIDGGFAYQTSDVRTTFDGWGAGMTLGKNLAYRPGGLLSFDIRGRLLFQRSYGTDWRASTGLNNNVALNGTFTPALDYLVDVTSPLDSSFVFSNYRTGMGELGLEGVLTFNRFRERTGIVFSLFGGLGLDAYRTRINQRGPNGELYNYLSIDRSNGRATALAELDALRDNTYESRADGTTDNGIGFGLMPGAGFELGYQVAPRFVIGIGHKITFSRTDVLDGQRWDNDNKATLGNDWAHYTNLHFRWDLQRSRRLRGPDVEITDPTTDPFISRDPSYFVRARVRNISSAADVQVSVNGMPQDFNFRNESVGFYARLRPGRNEVRVRAANVAGSDEDAVVIIWEDRTSVPPPPGPVTPAPSRREPTVRITDPGRSMNTDRDNIYLRAEVRNVDNARQVRVTVNGDEVRSTLAEGVEANVPLTVGRNTIRIDVQNNDGRASDEVIVTRTSVQEPPAPPTGSRPTITLSQPRGGTANTTDAEYEVVASITGIERQSDITFLVNGREVSNFSYTDRNRTFRATVRFDQRNEIDVTIRARNRFGEGEASGVIRRTTSNPPPPPVQAKPTVQVTNPDNGEEVSQANQSFTATTRNVSNKNEVSVVLNGNVVRDFNFNDKNNQVTGQLEPREGDNTLTVKVQTAAGQAESTVRFRYRKPVEKPTVTISDPADGSETDRDEITYRAATTKITDKRDITVLLNGAAVSDVNFNALNGVVSGKLRPRDGDNTLTIRVQNSAGQAESSVRFRLRKQQTAKPAVTISAPGNGTEVSTAAADLRATVTNVDNKSAITVQVNGRAITNFDFAPTSGQVTARVTLNEDDNTIRVAASNSAGSAEATSRVKYTNKRPPTVEITNPRNKSKVTDPNVNFAATTTNVTQASQVTVTLNGAAVNVNFDRAGAVTAKMALREGSNTIEIRVSTPDGSATDQATVAYTAPAAPPVQTANKPTVTFTQPGGMKNKPVTDKNYTYRARVTGVNDASKLKVTHNGQAVSQPNFNAKTGEVSFGVTLNPGKNTAKIEATNTAGTTSAEASVTYNAPAADPEPVIDNFSASVPTVNPMNPSVGRSSVTATLRSVTDRSQISLKVNDTAFTNFNFTPASGSLTASVNLQKGTNKITLTLTTPGGTTSQTRNVEF
jgi:large repetitive protein